MNDVKYPELPKAEGAFETTDDGRWVEAPAGADSAWLTPLYSDDQMRSYADATCALRGAQKESVPALTWADGMREAADMCAAQAARAVDLRWTPQPDHVAARALKDMQSQILRFVTAPHPDPRRRSKVSEQLMQLIDNYVEARHKHGAPEFNSITAHQRDLVREALSTHHAAPGAPQQEEAVMCNRCGGTGHVDDGYLTHSEGGIPYFEPIKRIKDCPACNGAGKAASRAAATAPAGGVTDFQAIDDLGPLREGWRVVVEDGRNGLGVYAYYKDKHDAEDCAFIAPVAVLTTAARAAEPEGWKLVPMKPTPEMMRAAFEAYTKPLDGSATRIIAAHKAMLAASPTPPVAARAAEPARKPLTKDQIDFILRDAFLAANGSVYSTRIYDFVREIEREHGIAASPTPPTGTSQGEGTP